MGSVEVDESQRRNSGDVSKFITKQLLDDCGAVNYASVPRKQRSAIKKRARESITPPFASLKEQDQGSAGVATLRKSAKKSKLNTKRGHIPKDEKEVAETLCALADLFSDTTKDDDKPGLGGEPSDEKNSTILEAGSSMIATEGTGIRKGQDRLKKISTGVNGEVASLPNILDLPVQTGSLDDSRRSGLTFSKQSDPHTSSGVQSALNLCSREKVLTYGMSSRGEQSIATEQVAALGTQYGKQSLYRENGNFGLYQSFNFSPSGDLTSKTRGASLQFPAWLENSNCTSQPHVTKTVIAPEKYPQVVFESKKSWKRGSAHVYISRLTKVLQMSKRNEDLPEKPTQALNDRSAVESFNGIPCSPMEKNSLEIQNAILLHKRLLQDQQLGSRSSSTKQGSDYLSLSGGVCDLNASAGVRATGYGEALRNYHMSYLQSQNQTAMPFSSSQNGYFASPHGGTSAVAAQQVQLPLYFGSTVNSNAMVQLGQQQKWTSPQYSNNGGFATAQAMSDWQSGGSGGSGPSSSLLNYAQALFPQLNSALGSKYQQLASQQQQFMAMNSSLPLSNVQRSQLQERWFFATPSNLS